MHVGVSKRRSDRDPLCPALRKVALTSQHNHGIIHSGSGTQTSKRSTPITDTASGDPSVVVIMHLCAASMPNLAMWADQSCASRIQAPPWTLDQIKLPQNALTGSAAYDRLTTVGFVATTAVLTTHREFAIALHEAFTRVFLHSTAVLDSYLLPEQCQSLTAK